MPYFYLKENQTENLANSPDENIFEDREVRRNLSQLSISQIAIEPNVVQNTEMSQGHE